ncbi:MATE family efflux transporter [Candidatus Hydrogenedentota bacterium]
MISNLFKKIHTRWHCEGGYKQLLSVAIPLIMSTGIISIQHCIDRVFLTWHSPEAIAAVMPAGVLCFTVMAFFIGTASYCGTFVSQYYGAGRPERIGPSIWQAVYVSIIGGAFLAGLAPFARIFFDLVGHEPSIRELEISYFQITALGSAPAIAGSALSAFYSGRGKTWPIMWISVLSTGVNILLDYVMIFGKWGFPAMGVRGAAIATVIASAAAVTAYLIIMGRKKYDQEFQTLSGWRFDKPLFMRLMKFGMPSGFQFFVDVAGFAFFILLMGRLGTNALAATNIAFNINTLAFMPMMGLGIAVSVLVGQYLGKDRSDLAERSVYSAFHFALVYMVGIASLFVFAPNMFLSIYAAKADAANFAAIRDTVTVLLRFLAVYTCFDSGAIIFSFAIKGAGDTKFVLYVLIASSLGIMVVPSYVVLVILERGIYAGWCVVSAFIITLAITFTLRFLGGKWKSMRVIEEVVPVIPMTLPENPATEFDV